jgi:Rieske Fe-S protein
MDLPRLAVRLGAACAAALLLTLLFLGAQHQGEVAAFAITDKSGAPLPVPATPTRELGTWRLQPVWVFVVPASELAGVDAARGPGSATPSIEVPGHPELRLFVLSAKSTYLGCTVGWNAQLGASRDIPDYNGDGVNDGRILDPCHQGQWDAFHRGAPVAGPAPERLASLDVRIVGDEMQGTWFDGPTAPLGHG